MVKDRGFSPMFWFWLALLFGVLICFFLFEDHAHAFPDMVRLGYASCTSCHVSPSGGGTLTSYGRGIANEELSTWSYEGESNVTHGLVGPIDGVLLGGDYRYLSLYSDRQRRDIPMQADVEVAMRVVPKLWAILSTGVYGLEHKRESRRNYLLLQTHEGLIDYRVGRFIPAYGLNVADHTTNTRRDLGFGEGAETYGAEVSLHTSWGEAFYTQTFGPELVINGSRSDGYQYDTNQECAQVVKAGLFLGEASTVGVSALWGRGLEMDRKLYGVYSTSAPAEWLYTLSEADHLQTLPHDGIPTYKTVAMETVGLVPYKGVHLEASVEAASEEMPTYGLSLQWFPRPHFEFLIKAKKQDKQDTVYGMVHYYL